MRRGFHLNLGGGAQKAQKYAHTCGCTAVQIFTHSPRSFDFKPLNEQEQTQIRAAWKEYDITVFSHCNYLINLGTQDNKLFHASVSTIGKELAYCAAFGCTAFVLHVGKHKEGTLEEGMAQVAEGINSLKKEIETHKVKILFETVAGQGTEIGRTFEEVRQLLDMIDQKIAPYIGVCVDTCHIFAAGYDIRTKEKAAAVITAIDKTIGLTRVGLIHVNDSKGELGGRLDRHERLGKGMIGTTGLAAFLTDKRLAHVPLVLETPYETPQEQQEDLEILNSFFA